MNTKDGQAACDLSEMHQVKTIFGLRCMDIKVIKQGLRELLTLSRGYRIEQILVTASGTCDDGEYYPPVFVGDKDAIAGAHETVSALFPVMCRADFGWAYAIKRTETTLAEMAKIISQDLVERTGLDLRHIGGCSAQINFNMVEGVVDLYVCEQGSYAKPPHSNIYLMG